VVTILIYGVNLSLTRLTAVTGDIGLGGVFGVGFTVPPLLLGGRSPHRAFGTDGEGVQGLLGEGGGGGGTGNRTTGFHIDGVAVTFLGVLGGGGGGRGNRRVTVLLTHIDRDIFLGETGVLEVFGGATHQDLVEEIDHHRVRKFEFTLGGHVVQDLLSDLVPDTDGASPLELLLGDRVPAHHDIM